MGTQACQSLTNEYFYLSLMSNSQWQIVYTSNWITVRVGLDKYEITRYKVLIYTNVGRKNSGKILVGY